MHTIPLSGIRLPLAWEQVGQCQDGRQRDMGFTKFEVRKEDFVFNFGFGFGVSGISIHSIRRDI